MLGTADYAHSQLAQPAQSSPSFRLQIRERLVSRAPVKPKIVSLAFFCAELWSSNRGARPYGVCPVKRPGPRGVNTEQTKKEQLQPTVSDLIFDHPLSVSAYLRSAAAQTAKTAPPSLRR